VTCPRDGSMPILKLVKYSARAIAPGIAGQTTGTEADGAFVLASFQLTADNLHVDENGDYRNMAQAMRLRIRRGDDQVVLEAYLNDRNVHDPLLSFTDYAGPLWGKVGVPGFEFLSATSATQPAGTSPYSEKGIPIMACHLFEAETVLDQEPSRTASPNNLYTYERVAQRVIQLVERNGDSKYTQTNNGATKLQVYLGFVTEAEKAIIREEGYFQWTYREEEIHLQDGINNYELPENCELLNLIRPGNWNGQPLREMTREEFSISIGNAPGGGQPQVYSRITPGPNSRTRVKLWPTPILAKGTDDFIVCEYYATPFNPYNSAAQCPFVPQQHIDVLIYQATALALLMDTDNENAALFQQRADKLLASLRVANNRKAASRTTVMRSASDMWYPTIWQQVPLLRTSQLGGLL
jgi:hypothetical protein